MAIGGSLTASGWTTQWRHDGVCRVCLGRSIVARAWRGCVLRWYAPVSTRPLAGRWPLPPRASVRLRTP
eukprot:5810563-Prymnesium_polylepis.1